MLDDFPSAPQFEVGTPESTADAFRGDSSSGEGPCIESPEPGTLYPKNWLRPRVELIAKTGHNAFEFTFSTDAFAHSLVVYSKRPEMTLSAELWVGLRNTVVDEPIRVSVRSATIDTKGVVTDGPTPPSETSFSVAPVSAPGKIVYWSLPKGDTAGGRIRGFGIGEEGVIDVLAPKQVAARGHTATCVGCHSATPDGDAVAFTVGPNGYRASIASVGAADVGEVPSLVLPDALATITQLKGVPAFSNAHWSPGDRTVLLSDAGKLRWVGLDSNRSGELSRTGDERAASVPSFSHDGERIVYTSAAGLSDGRPEHGPMDLRVIPYAEGQGGISTPLAGAAEAAYNEYYPAYSPDDALVAFTRVPDALASYDAPMAEVLVVPASGGSALRLQANDPPACVGGTSPGITNSWPKWSPSAPRANGKTYYFLTFSSRRRGLPQLYVTALVDDGQTLTSYPASYLWNQPADEGNHTPDWAEIRIPPVVPK